MPPVSPSTFSHFQAAEQVREQEVISEVSGPEWYQNYLEDHPM